jgi:uncharacterized protein YlzI (FlbEa/FlbD family)
MIELTNLKTNCLVFVNPDLICSITHEYIGCAINFQNSSILVKETNLDVYDLIRAYKRKNNESL